MPETLDLILGPAGEAHLSAARPNSTAQTAQLATWILRVPNATPQTEMFMLALVHLRHIPGEQAPNRMYPEAEYELILLALNPAMRPRVDDQSTWWGIIPAKARVQFHGIDDEHARRLTRLAASAVVHGFLPAEPAFHNGGEELWWNGVWTTISHFNDPDRSCGGEC